MIKGKRYYRVTFRLASALAVGSGKNEETDKDLVRDSRGIPYIPATALAGIYRSLFNEESARHYFGDVAADGEALDSRFIIYDAVIKEGQDYRISYRDGVGLDGKKTAIDGAKFNFEILEPGIEFVTYIEQDKYDGDRNAGDLIADAWMEGRIAIGGKTSRGLGRIKDVRIGVKEFSLEKDEEIDKWLDFSPYDGEFEELREEEKLSDGEGRLLAKSQEFVSIRLKLKQKGPVSIRVYTTRVDKDNVPDYEQLAYVRKNQGRDEEIPVVPGTSWAGAFRHQMERLGVDCMEDYFGKKSEQRSRIQFGESEIHQASAKVVTRNAIDRFTGGTIDTALYTEKFFYGGKTELVITLPTDAQEAFLKCLAAAIVDLHMGILFIGGETSVGHGIFSIEEIILQDHVIVPAGPEQLYRDILSGMLHSQEVAEV